LLIANQTKNDQLIPVVLKQLLSLSLIGENKKKIATYRKFSNKLEENNGEKLNI
jgi:hypothetical protein